MELNISEIEQIPENKQINVRKMNNNVKFNEANLINNQKINVRLLLVLQL